MIFLSRPPNEIAHSGSPTLIYARQTKTLEIWGGRLLHKTAITLDLSSIEMNEPHNHVGVFFTNNVG